MRVPVIVTVAVLCAACASLPSKEQLTAFGDASTKGVSTVTAVVASRETLRLRQNELRQASNYMRGKRFSAVSIPTFDTPQGSAKAQDELTTQLQIRLDALNDLQAYSKAVGDAADQGTVDDLVAATEKLATNIGKLAAVAAPNAAAVLVPAFKVAGEIAGYGLADSYVRRVNAIIKQADPVVAEVIRLLRADLAGLSADIDIEAESYAGLRDEQLHVIRDDPRVRRSELYNAYLSARTDIATNFELAKAATAVDGVLMAIANTHHALAENKPDVALTTERMSALSSDLATVITALKQG